MKRLLFLVFLLFPVLAHAQTLFSGNSLLMQILPYIFVANAQMDIASTSPKYWLNLLKKDRILYKVALCESNLDPYRHGPEPYGLPDSLGLLQFQPATWDKWTKMMDFEDADIWSPYDQITVYHWAAKRGLLRAWTCFRRLFP